MLLNDGYLLPGTNELTHHNEHWVYYIGHVDGWAQERYNTSALAMELHISCTNPLIYECMNEYMIYD